MARYKTPEEIEADKKLFAERYPEQVQSSGEDPTQPFRNLIKNAIASTDTPIGNSLKEEPKKEFEMSPEIKKYGYDLFGIKDLAGDVEQEIPFAPKEVPSVEEKIPSTDIKSRQPASIVESPQKQISKIESQKPIQQEPEKAITPISSVQTEQQSDIEKLIKQSEEEEDRVRLSKQSAKLRDAIMGAGLGRIKQTDVSMYEDLEKKAKRPIQNLLLKQELEDKQAQRDPNSNISKLMRKSLEDLGMNMSGLEGVPYSQLEKLYPALTQGLYTKIAAEARKEENSLKRAERADAKLEKLDQNKQKELVKHIDYSINNLKKSYENYSKSQTTIDSIGNILGAAKNKITPGTADVTMLYSFISSLDPASTVREGEIALSKSAMSLWGRMKQGTAQLVGGDLLDPATRKSIEEIMKAVQSAREKQFARQKANLIEAGIGKGLDKNMLNSYIYPEIDASSALAKSKKAEVSEKENVQFSKQYKPGSVITLKDGNKYIIQEDGVTGVKK